MPEPDEALDCLGARLRDAVERIAPGRGPTVWLSENAVDADGQQVMNVNTAADFLRPVPRRGWIAAHRMAAIADAVHWPDSAVYIGNATDLGLDPPPGVSDFAAGLPKEANQLPRYVKEAIREQTIAACRLAGLLGPTD